MCNYLGHDLLLAELDVESCVLLVNLLKHRALILTCVELTLDGGRWLRDRLREEHVLVRLPGLRTRSPRLLQLASRLNGLSQAFRLAQVSLDLEKLTKEQFVLFVNLALPLSLLEAESCQLLLKAVWA